MKWFKRNSKRLSLAFWGVLACVGLFEALIGGQQAAWVLVVFSVVMFIRESIKPTKQGEDTESGK